jgi:Tfp pilus assembly protein PilO
MNFLTPTILIIVSIAVFFGFIDPNYRGTDPVNRSVQSLQAEDNQYQEALNNSTKIRQQRDMLIDKKNNFSDDQISRLEQLLPDNVDNIQLVISIKNIAQNHGLTLKNIKLSTGAPTTDTKKIGSDTNKYGTVGLSFGVASSYDSFQNFLTDLEKSLRLVDITDLAVTANDIGTYDFTVSLKTYWLK